MIGYNPSHLNKNETLLEAFHRVEAYLKANPQYQVFQSSATYQEGTQEYALNTIVVPEGSSVGKGDVVLFSNVYYAVITAVSETTFSVETATNFRGTTGATGANGTDGKDGVTPNISMNATVENNGGDLLVKVTKSGTNENPLFTLGFHNIKGATGDKGETGLPALMYSKGVVTGPYQSFYTDLDGYNRTPQINDSCVYVSTNNDRLILGTIQQVFSDTQKVNVNKVFSIDIEGSEGPRGPQGVNGRNGRDGISTLLYAGELSESVTTAEIAQVTMPTDRVIQVYDILISTSPNTFGAMAQVTGLGQTTATVNFIGTLQSESGGGTTLNKYTYTGRRKDIIMDILKNAKRLVSFGTIGYPSMSITPSLFGIAENMFVLSANWADPNNVGVIYVGASLSQTSGNKNMTADDWRIKKIKNDGTIENYTWNQVDYMIVYYNDTEIT